jgi:hypothetical protein
LTGLSAQDEKKCLLRWRRWILRLKSEVGDLLGRREIFVGVRAILQLNPEVGDPNSFINWMIRNYVEATTVGVRRLCDARDDVESLSHLLRQLLQHPDVLTLAAHSKLYPARRRADAQGTFERLAGIGRTTLSPQSIRGDLRRLEDTAARIQRFVNKKIAHAAPTRDIRRGPTYGELGRALEMLDEITVKYLVLLTANGYSTCARVRARDWRKVLLVPWLDREDLKALAMGSQ